jgi:hypothetical protein
MERAPMNKFIVEFDPFVTDLGLQRRYWFQFSPRESDGSFGLRTTDEDVDQGGKDKKQALFKYAHHINKNKKARNRALK